MTIWSGTRFCGYTMDLTNRNGMQGKQLTSSDTGGLSHTDFPGGGSPQTQQSLTCYLESFTDYLQAFPWPAMIGCFMNTNTPGNDGNVALLYYGSGAGSTTEVDGYPTFEGQLTTPSQSYPVPAGTWTTPKAPGGGTPSAAVPIISWDLGATSLAAIADGSYDTSTIIPAANACKNWPGQVIIRLCHEMNGTWSGYCPGNTDQPSNTTCATFVAMWQHIVQVFANEGAFNARWLWCPNVAGSGAATPDQSGYSRTSGTTALLYPGDAYVDYVGLDGYNDAHSGNWQTFSQVFQASYNWIYNGDAYTNGPITTTKPMIIGEVGCWEADEMSNVPNGQTKAAWISAMVTTIEDNMPNVGGVCWWHETDGTSVEYYVTSSSGSTSAWDTLANSFTGAVPTITGVTKALAPPSGPVLVQRSPVVEQYITSGSPDITLTLPDATGEGNTLVCYIGAFGNGYGTSPTSIGVYPVSDDPDDWGVVASAVDAGIASIAVIATDPDCVSGQTQFTVTTNGSTSGGNGQTVIAYVEEWEGQWVLDKAEGTVQTAAGDNWTSGDTAETTTTSDLAVACAFSFSTSGSFTLAATGSGWTNIAAQYKTGQYPMAFIGGYQALSSEEEIAYAGTATYKTSACVAALKAA